MSYDTSRSSLYWTIRAYQVLVKTSFLHQSTKSATNNIYTSSISNVPPDEVCEAGDYASRGESHP